jgi:hypothetical protein
MAGEPEPPKSTSWSIYKVAKKAAWLGTVEASDAATAIEKAAAEFRVDTWRLLAVGVTMTSKIARTSAQYLGALPFAHCRTRNSNSRNMLCCKVWREFSPCFSPRLHLTQLGLGALPARRGLSAHVAPGSGSAAIAGKGTPGGFPYRQLCSTHGGLTHLSTQRK